MDFLMSRLAGPVAGGLALLLALALAWVTFDKNGTIRALRDEIHNPRTGYAVRLQAVQQDLVQCRTNRITLEEATRRQNAAVAAARAESGRRIAELERTAADRERARLAAQAEARRILERRGTGNPCADADALILELVG